MWRSVLILMLALRFLGGSAVCCCTLSAWSNQLFGSTATASCCCPTPDKNPSDDSSPAPMKVPHQCPCRHTFETTARTDTPVLNYQSLQIESVLDKLLAQAPSFFQIDVTVFDAAREEPRSGGQFPYQSRPNILSLLQCLRC